jgi:hypothetical protein
LDRFYVADSNSVIDPDVGLGGVGEKPWGYAIVGDAKAQTLRAVEPNHSVTTALKVAITLSKNSNFILCLPQ